MGLNGTDATVFKKELKKNKKRGVGRPKANRDLARRLFEAKLDNAEVAARLKITPKYAGDIRRELISQGILVDEKAERRFIKSDFDEECKRATGFSFYEWITNKQKSGGKTLFNFCKSVWESEIWDRPSLVLAADMHEPEGDRLAMAFVSAFNTDEKRFRRRLKQIRRLFAFLGRSDIEDKHLTMDNKNAPRAVKEVPQISFNVFPINLQKAIDEFEETHGPQAALWIKMKITTGIRTGERKEGRGLLGLSTDVNSPSYVIFQGDEYQSRVYEKKGEIWALNWLPKAIRDALEELYKETMKDKTNKYFFRYAESKKNMLSKAWQKISLKHTGVALTFHDMRKVSITWLYAMEIPLEIATSINVGWKDLSTASDHYLQLRRGPLMRRSGRIAYRENIPEWYKDGLDDFRRDEAITRVKGRFQ